MNTINAKISSNPQVAKINLNFLIRWKNQNENKTNLISAGQYNKLVGENLKIKHFNKVLNGGLDKYTFYIRKRLKIEFVSK